MRRNACSDTSQGLRKGPWTSEEDQKLVSCIQQHGQRNWDSLPHKAGLLRGGMSCRLRWSNYLRPNINRGDFSPEEDQTIIQLHALYGNKWSTIAQGLRRRTDNEIKNYWNTKLKRRLTKTKTSDIIPNNAHIPNECHKNFNYTCEARLSQVITSSKPRSLPNKVTNKQILNQLASKVSLINRDTYGHITHIHRADNKVDVVGPGATSGNSVHDLINVCDTDDHDYFQLASPLNGIGFGVDPVVEDLESSINWCDSIFD